MYHEILVLSRRYEPVVDNCGDLRAGKIGLQRKIDGYLVRRFGTDFGLEFPTGQHSTDETSNRVMTVVVDRSKVYKAYCESFQDLRSAMMEVKFLSQSLTQTVSLKTFNAYRRQDVPTLFEFIGKEETIVTFQIM